MASGGVILEELKARWSGIADWWQSVERDWLGVTSYPPAEQIARAGWSPEAFHRSRPVACPMCGHTLAPGECLHSKKRCSACLRRRYPWSRLIRLGPYVGELRDWIHAIKFERDEAMARTLGYLLGQAVGDANGNAGRRPSAVVPIPMPFRRRIRRGIDHTAVVARSLSKSLGAPMVAGLRRDARPPQRAVAAAERRRNVRGAFHVVRPSALRGANVVLVDDVTTTQSTIIEAAKTLRERAGVDEVIVAVLAVAEERRR